MTAELMFGLPGKPFQLADALFDAFGKNRNGGLAVRLGFAYASSTGLDTILNKLEKISPWLETPKEWIIGLHHGITEPLALKRILALPNSFLRLYVDGKRLSEGTIRGGAVFHGKIACITVGEQSIMLA